MNKKNKQKKISTQPYKGARDFYPEDMRIQNYIFDIWRKVCKRYGFEEWDSPFIEPWELYAAKSGEEIVNRQLYSFTDKGARKVAIRPEKTPSLARMIAGKLQQLPQPIKWFNIANCWRFEKPQKGRSREFFQLDCDILGVKDVTADVEVFSIPIEIMKELGANDTMFEIRISNRRLAEFYLRDIVKLDGGISKQGTQMYKVTRIIDSKPKITDKEFLKRLEEQNVKPEQMDKIISFIKCDISFIEKYQKDSYGAKEIIDFLKISEKMGYAKYFKFRPEIMRGLDYYTGNVIEQFDLDPTNNRSMYGGGRYDDLVNIFTNEELTGIGYAMGDVTLLEFLKGWNLLPTLPGETQVMVTIFNENTTDKSFEIVQKLREAGINTLAYLEPAKLDKQLKYADRKGLRYVIVVGPDEIEKGTVQLKDMRAKKQKELTLKEVIIKLKG